MAASPPQSLSAGEGDHISLFLDTDLGTRLALNVAADSTIRGLKSQVSVNHAAAFPDLGTVSVKSFQVRRKGAMYHLSDSMAVRSAFSKVKAGYFLHVKMAAPETGTQYCRDEDRGKSTDKLPPMLEGDEDATVWVNVHAHDVHPSSSSQWNIERTSTAVCLATDVRTIYVPVIDKSESCKQGKKHMGQTEGVYVNSASVANINGLTNQSNVLVSGKEAHTREEDILHSVGDRELGCVSVDKKMRIKEETLGELHALGDLSVDKKMRIKEDTLGELHALGDLSVDKKMRIKEETLGELHALGDLSQEKNGKKARVTSSFDTSAVDPARETNDSKTSDGENFDKLPLEINTNSREVLSDTSFQQEVDGNVKEDSIQLENSIITGKNKKKSKLVTSKEVSAREMTEPSTGAVELPKATGEEPLHENQGLQGDGASNVEMTSRDKTKIIPPDILLSSSQLNSGSQATKHVQPGTDAQATSDLGADQSNIDLVHERYRNPVIGDISISTCKVVSGEENSAERTNDGDHDGSTVDTSNMEKGSKREDILETLDNISQKKTRKKSKKASSVGLTSMDTAEAKDQCRYGEKAGKSDIISTQQEIVNDPYKRQTASNVQQGDSSVIENSNDDVKRKKRRQTANNVQEGDSNVIANPNDDVKRKKRRRHYPESLKDDRTQDATESSGFIMNASSAQNTSTRCLDAKQITLGNIEEAADEKDQCRHEKVAGPVIVSTQGVNVNDPSNAQQGDSDVTKNPNGDGKPKKKKKRHLESFKDDPTQDETKPSALIKNGSSIQNTSADPLNAEQTTEGAIGEATVSDCRKVDETVDVATTNVINEVLADLRCTDNSSKVLNGDLLMEQNKGGADAALPPSAIQSDLPISSRSYKSKGKPVKILSTALDLSHSSGGVPDEKISNVKDVLNENTVVQANGRTKSTKRQRNKVFLKHVPTDSGTTIQSLEEQVRHVPAEDMKGENCTKAELFQGCSAIDAPASTDQIIQKESKRSLKSRTSEVEEVNHSTHGHENQFVSDSQDKHVADIDGTHKNEKIVGAPIESPVVQKDDTAITRDKPNNARKGRKESSKTELQSQDTNVEHGSDADFMNNRAQQVAVIPEGSSDAVEPNDYVVVQPDNDKINFIDHFSPSATNGPSDSAKYNDETISEVKGKKKSKYTVSTCW